MTHRLSPPCPSSTPGSSPRPRLGPTSLLAAGALVLLGAGCPWPRYSDLPDDTDVFDASEDPRAGVPMTWTEETEDALSPGGADNADPRNVTPVPLESLQGLAVDGTLRGAGWNESFDAPPLEGEGCTASSRDVGRGGDWAGDVDFSVIEVVPGGQVLCADVALTEPALGWDLLLFPLDTANCDLPTDPVSGPDGELLGFGRSGPTGGWKHPVEPGLYGVLLAAYTGPDPVAETSYELGLSLVPSDERGTELCPRLPGQGAL